MILDVVIILVLLFLSTQDCFIQTEKKTCLGFFGCLTFFPLILLLRTILCGLYVILRSFCAVISVFGNAGCRDAVGKRSIKLQRHERAAGRPTTQRQETDSLRLDYWRRWPCGRGGACSVSRRPHVIVKHLIIISFPHTCNWPEKLWWHFSSDVCLMCACSVEYFCWFIWLCLSVVLSIGVQSWCVHGWPVCTVICAVL